MAAAVANRVDGMRTTSLPWSSYKRQEEDFYLETKRIVTACVQMPITAGEVTQELSEQQQRLIELVDSRVRINEEFFRNTCVELRLTATDVHDKLMDVWQGIFQDGIINSGRIVALLCFSQYVTVYARVEGLPSITASVPHWASVFINSHLKNWIVDHGGWVRDH